MIDTGRLFAKTIATYIICIGILHLQNLFVMLDKRIQKVLVGHRLAGVGYGYDGMSDSGID